MPGKSIDRYASPWTPYRNKIVAGTVEQTAGTSWPFNVRCRLSSEIHAGKQYKLEVDTASGNDVCSVYRRQGSSSSWSDFLTFDTSNSKLKFETSSQAYPDVADNWLSLDEGVEIYTQRATGFTGDEEFVLTLPDEAGERVYHGGYTCWVKVPNKADTSTTAGTFTYELPLAFERYNLVVNSTMNDVANTGATTSGNYGTTVQTLLNPAVSGESGRLDHFILITDYDFNTSSNTNRAQLVTYHIDTDVVGEGGLSKGHRFRLYFTDAPGGESTKSFRNFYELTVIPF